MFPKERYEQIYQILQERNGVTMQYLKKKLGVSEATIRRDLEAMENDGLLKRVWGGAMLQSRTDKDPPLLVRTKENNDKKQKIARIASKLLKESSVVFMDGSTTTMCMVPYFSQFKQVSVVTYGLHMQQALTEQTNVSVYLLGGQVFEKRLMTGHVALSNVKQFHADIFFFASSGLSAEFGVTGSEVKSVEICKAMLARSKIKVLLCDTSKVGMNFMWTTAMIDDLDYVIMDSVPNNKALVKALGSKLITDASQLSRIR